MYNSNISRVLIFVIYIEAHILFQLRCDWIRALRRIKQPNMYKIIEKFSLKSYYRKPYNFTIIIN